MKHKREPKHDALKADPDKMTPTVVNLAILGRLAYNQRVSPFTASQFTLGV
ncbi:MAG: hypothetical protein ACE5MK_03240 [Acidobacteriota bacterium]